MDDANWHEVTQIEKKICTKFYFGRTSKHATNTTYVSKTLARYSGNSHNQCCTSDIHLHSGTPNRCHRTLWYFRHMLSNFWRVYTIAAIAAMAAMATTWQCHLINMALSQGVSDFSMPQLPQDTVVCWAELFKFLEGITYCCHCCHGCHLSKT